MSTMRQRVMHCPCGDHKVLALGLCATCYTLRRQDEEYFGGLREAVLGRDGHRCRVCDASGRDKRSIIVHHLAPYHLDLGLGDRRSAITKHPYLLFAQTGINHVLFPDRFVAPPCLPSPS